MPPDDAIQSSGQITLSDIYDEFTGTHSNQEIQLSDYHDEGNAPASGEIQLAADFYGTSASNAPNFVGNRGIGAGGNLYPMGDGNVYVKKLINYKAITSSGNASDFGDLTDDVAYGAGVSNGSRFIQIAGED